VFYAVYGPSRRAPDGPAHPQFFPEIPDPSPRFSSTHTLGANRATQGRASPRPPAGALSQTGNGGKIIFLAPAAPPSHYVAAGTGAIQPRSGVSTGPDSGRINKPIDDIKGRVVADKDSPPSHREAQGTEKPMTALKELSHGTAKAREFFSFPRPAKEKWCCSLWPRRFKTPTMLGPAQCRPTSQGPAIAEAKIKAKGADKEGRKTRLRLPTSVQFDAFPINKRQRGGALGQGPEEGRKKRHVMELLPPETKNAKS